MGKLYRTYVVELIKRDWLKQVKSTVLDNEIDYERAEKWTHITLTGFFWDVTVFLGKKISCKTYLRTISLCKGHLLGLATELYSNLFKTHRGFSETMWRTSVWGVFFRQLGCGISTNQYLLSTPPWMPTRPSNLPHTRALPSG
jgi:hypothetical protein